jgi:hypothetical protein
MWSPCGCNTQRNRTICTSAPNLQSIQVTHLMFSTKRRNISNSEKNWQENKRQKNRFQISTPFYYHDIPKRCPFEEIRERSKQESKEEDWNPQGKKIRHIPWRQIFFKPKFKSSTAARWKLAGQTCGPRPLKKEELEISRTQRCANSFKLSQLREKERGRTTVPQDLGFRIRRTTTTRQKTKIRRGKVGEWIDERDQTEDEKSANGSTIFFGFGHDHLGGHLWSSSLESFSITLECV